MNDFHRDNAWQAAVRDRFLAPFYGAHSLGGRYVFVDKSRCSALIQKRLAVDTVLQSKKGGSICIEEKITRPTTRPLRNFFLEVESCSNPGHESPGWMTYGEADFLFYCFARGPVSEDPRTIEALDCFLIDFQRLVGWFWPVSEAFRLYTMPNTINHTRGRLVPISAVVENVKTHRYSLTPRRI